MKLFKYFGVAVLLSVAGLGAYVALAAVMSFFGTRVDDESIPWLMLSAVSFAFYVVVTEFEMFDRGYLERHNLPSRLLWQLPLATLTALAMSEYLPLVGLPNGWSSFQWIMAVGQSEAFSLWRLWAEVGFLIGLMAAIMTLLEWGMRRSILASKERVERFKVTRVVRTEPAQ